MKDITKITRLAVAVLTLFNMPAQIHAEPANAPAGGSTTAARAAPLWYGDDGPYRRAFARIGIEAKSAKNPTTVVALYKAKALANPTDPYSVFCWATAYYDAPDYAATLTQAFVERAAIVSALSVPPSPHTYDYDRIRYLVCINQDWQNPELKSLGEKLLAANNDDFDVLECVGFSTVDLAQSVSLLEAAVKLRPSAASTYWFLGATYLDGFNTPKPNLEDGRKSVAMFKKFLSLARPDATVPRYEARQMIGVISYVINYGKAPPKNATF